MTGYELLKAGARRSGIRNNAFIMVTAESKTENVIAAKRAGVDNYIVKPFNAQTLQHKIQAVFPDEQPPPQASFCLSMIFSENRVPLFGSCLKPKRSLPPGIKSGQALFRTMLQVSASTSPRRPPWSCPARFP